jgi:predicted DNA-binding transcriptional regulator YafY
MNLNKNPRKDWLLTLLDIFNNETDEQHPLSTTQLLERLEKRGIIANRRTIPGDIETLISHGIDIVSIKSSKNLYYIGERHFEMPELRLLIDAVLSSKFITPKKSRALINKLHKMVSKHQKADLAEGVYLPDVKPLNESIYIAEEIIRAAIHQKKQVTFKYFEYSPNKKKEFKHNGYLYHFSPYRLIWSEDKYYALGYSDKHSKVVTFRVDRMFRVKAKAEDYVPKSTDFDVSEFCKRAFEMYDGKIVMIELECDNDLMKVIIDKFGEKVQTEIIDQNRFKVTTEVCVSPMFYGWLFQFTGRMKLTSPAEVVNEYKKMLKQAVK